VRQRQVRHVDVVPHTGSVRRRVVGSSNSVYGINEKIPFCEEDPLLTPISPYTLKKGTVPFFGSGLTPTSNTWYY